MNSLPEDSKRVSVCLLRTSNLAIVSLLTLKLFFRGVLLFSLLNEISFDFLWEPIALEAYMGSKALGLPKLQKHPSCHQHYHSSVSVFSHPFRFISSGVSVRDPWQFYARSPSIAPTVHTSLCIVVRAASVDSLLQLATTYLMPLVSLFRGFKSVPEPKHSF